MFGYRRADVEEALVALGSDLEARDATIELCGRKLEQAVRAIESRDTRIAELDLAARQLARRVVDRERELRAAQAELARLHGESDKAVRALGAVADELGVLRSQARGQATRIRLRALRDAVEVSDRIADLTRRPAEARERLLEALGDAIARLGEGALAPPAGSNGREPEAEAEDLFEGVVEVEVGPLDDFAQLVGFEDAAAGIGAAHEISVKRFAKG
ncbi:MAG: FUSC family protein, partial [Actinomycetota bacterium]|nr:FUSC family protein [Actinomycetota bacterium]